MAVKFDILSHHREIRLLRHVELTDEDKERLRGSYKVAKKLEKLEGKQRGDSEDEDSDNNELELPSLESVGSDLSLRATSQMALTPTTKRRPLSSGELFSPSSETSGSNR